MNNGAVVEKGSHEELIVNSEGIYATLVSAQRLREHHVDLGETSMPSTSVAVDKDLKEDEELGTSDSHDPQALSELPSGYPPIARPLANRGMKLGTVLYRLFTFGADQKPLYLLGTLSAITFGAVYPAYGIIFGTVLYHLGHAFQCLMFP
jgi:ATP-binding cassette, subfamily B (MDR/TAP), member 1